MFGEGIDRESAIKRAADLLRSGATLLAETCPVCGSPLLRLVSGEVVCPIHGRVMIAKTESDIAEASILSVLTELEKNISSLLLNYNRRIQKNEVGFEDARDLVYWLDAIERIEKIKRLIQHPTQKKSSKSTSSRQK